MRPWKYDDLPPHMQRQIDAMRAKAEPSPAPPPRNRAKSKTEEQYERELIAVHGRDNVRYEGITLKLINGHKYTPDFVILGGARITLIEVKGGYKLPSYQRARMAFDQARIDWPMFSFVWVEK